MSQFSLDSAAVVVLVPLSPPAAGHGADISPTMLMIITSITGIPNTSENKNEFLHLQRVNRYEHRAEFNITLKYRVCSVPYCTHSSLSPIMSSYLTYWMNCVVELPCLFIKSCLESDRTTVSAVAHYGVYYGCTNSHWAIMLSLVALDMTLLYTSFHVTLTHIFLHSLELQCCFCIICCLLEKVFSAVLSVVI